MMRALSIFLLAMACSCNREPADTATLEWTGNPWALGGLPTGDPTGPCVEFVPTGAVLLEGDEWAEWEHLFPRSYLVTHQSEEQVWTPEERADEPDVWDVTIIGEAMTALWTAVPCR